MTSPDERPTRLVTQIGFALVAVFILVVLALLLRPVRYPPRLVPPTYFSHQPFKPNLVPVHPVSALIAPHRNKQAKMSRRKEWHGRKRHGEGDEGDSGD